MINRIIRDDPSKGDMHNRQPITPALLWRSLKDYDLWPIYIIGLVWGIPSTAPTQYLTIILRSLGFSVVMTNLLTVPYLVLTIATCLALTYLSEIFRERSLMSMTSQVWLLPFIIVLNTIDITQINRWVAWAILTLLLGYPYGE